MMFLLSSRFPRSVLTVAVLSLMFALFPRTYAAQMQRIAIIDVAGEPGFAEMAFARGMLIIAHQSADRADIFDPVRRRVVAQIDGLKDPVGIAVDDVHGRVYISNSGDNTVAVISSKTWKVERTIPLQEAPYDLLVSPDGKILYVANWRAQSISAVAIGGQGTVNTRQVNGAPQAMAFDAAEDRLYVTLQDCDQVAVLDPSLQIVKRFHLAASQPTGIALDGVAHRLYVAVRYAVVALDSNSGAEIARVPAPAGANSPWLADRGNLLYLASGGGYVDLIRISGSTMSVEEEVHTDVRGNTLAYDAGRNLLYLPGGREGQAKMAILKGFAPPQAVRPNQPQVAEKHP